MALLKLKPFQDWRVRTKLVTITLPFIALVALTAAWALYARDAANLEEKLTQRARSLSTQIMADRKYYTSVILPLAIELGGSVGEDYKQVHGRFPLPATFVREVSELTAAVREGYTANLISPWPINKDKGAKDQFQKDAFAYLLDNPNGVYYRTDLIAGMSVMRFITADRASVQVCADCHNAHPRSPKHDFKLNDVMGGLEIVMPIDQYLKESRRQITLVMAGSAGVSLLILGIVAWGARQAILRPLARLTERLQKNLRRVDGGRYLANSVGSHNEMLRFEQACLDMQAALAKQENQFQIATRPIEERVEDHTAALLEAQERFRLVIDYTKHAIFYLDKTGAIRWANKQAVELTARLISDLMGRSFLSMLTPQSAALAKTRLTAVQRRETIPSVAELEVVQSTGGSVWIEATMVNVRENERVVGWLLIARKLIRPASLTPE
jgi:PAS domain S-box-containing protein